MPIRYYVRRMPDGTVRYSRPYEDTPEEQLLRSIFGPIAPGPLRDPCYCWTCGAGPNVYCDHDPRPAEDVGCLKGDRGN